MADEDYYSIQSILADNHKLTCTFNLTVPGLGYLEGGTEEDDSAHNEKLQENAKVELPFWVAKVLSNHLFTTFPLPPPYSPRVKSALIASAPSVKLSNQVGTNGWWYRWGSKIADVLDDKPQADMLKMLFDAFSARLPPLQDLSAHHASSDHSMGESGAGSGENFREGMEGDERELFRIGQESGQMIKAWYDSAWGQKAFGKR